MERNAVIAIVLVAAASQVCTASTWMQPASPEGHPGAIEREPVAEGIGSNPTRRMTGRITFLEDTGGRWEVTSMRPDGSDQRSIAIAAPDISRLTASRDGKTLLAVTLSGELWL